MKKSIFRTAYYSIILCMLYAGSAFANYNNKTIDIDLKDLKEQARELVKQKPLGFQENKGQMAGIDNSPASFVLFKAEIPDLNIWVTNTGLTYQFFTIDKKMLSNSDDSPKPGIDGKQEKEKTLRWHRVDMVLKDASIKKENILAEGDITQGEVNYYLGHCPDGVFNVKTYTKITIREVYPGIDWILYASALAPSTVGRVAEGLKHDFIVHPNADPNQIKLVYEGSGNFQVENNHIQFKNDLGQLTEGGLLCYQGNETNLVQSDYLVKQNQTPIYAGAGNLPASLPRFPNLPFDEGSEELFSYEVSFNFSPYDKALPLIIDPQLVWATFYGGNGFDIARSATTDNLGNLFVTGHTQSVDFPLQTWSGAYNQGSLNSGQIASNGDVFILKFQADGSRQWATYYGGLHHDWGHSIAADNAGNIFVTGKTESGNFPRWNWAGAYNQNVWGGGISDGFILKFQADGSRQWATYYGGNQVDEPTSITTDNAGNIFVTGFTLGSFPLQNWAGAYNRAFMVSPANQPDAFILKFTADGACQWATCYGGIMSDEGCSITTDNDGNIFVTGGTASLDFPIQNWSGAYNQAFKGIGTGADAFILKFLVNGSLQWATYYGGSAPDVGASMAIDSAGNIFVTGGTQSGDFPIQNWGGAYNQAIYGGGTDAFILKFLANGSLQWGTWYGGSSTDGFPNGQMAIDDCGNVYIIFPAAANMPLHVSTCGEYGDNSFNGANADLYITRFSSTGTRVWDTYFGGNANDFSNSIAVDKAGNLYVAGGFNAYLNTSSSSYPLTNPGGGAYYDSLRNGSGDGFLAKFIPVPSTYTQSQVNATCNSCDGSATINISCGNPDYSYVWSNGSSTMNTSSITNTIGSLCPGTYTVTVTSNCNQTQTATFVISSTPPDDASFSYSQSTFCQTGTDPLPTITGLTGGVFKADAGLSIDAASGIIDLAASTLGTYTVTYTTNGPCPNTGTFSVTITLTPDATFSYTGPYCQNETPDPSPVFPMGASAGVFSSTPSGVIFISTITGQIDLSASAPGTYTVANSIAASGGCPAASFDTTVTINTAPVLTISNPAAVCSPEMVDLTAAVVTSGSTGGGTLTYWTDPAATNTLSSPNAVAANGTYYIKSTTTAGCSDIDPVTVTIHPPPVLVITDPATVCSPGPVDITAAAVTAGSIGGGTLSYWTDAAATNSLVSPNAVTIAGTYYIQSTMATGCSDIEPVTVTFHPLPAPVVTPAAASICTGAGTSLTASGASIYSWSPASGLSSTSDATVTANPVATTTYTVTGTDTNTCVNTTAVTVTVHELPTLSVTSDSVCEGENTMINAIATGGTAPYTYLWNPGAMTGATVSVSPSTTTAYTVIVSDANNCSSSPQLATVNVFPNPIARFDMMPPDFAPLSNPLILFTDQSIGADNWLWNFGDILNSSSSLQNPKFAYSELGSYTITLTVINNEGCTDTVSHTIIIEPEFTLYIPNAFTPDGDGLNDFFAPQGAHFDSFEMEIYNRWGEKVAHPNPSRGEGLWDGAINGKDMAPQGVYVYKLWLKDFKGQRHYYIGNVTLIR